MNSFKHLKAPHVVSNLTVIPLLVTLPSMCCLCMNQATRGSGLPSKRQSKVAVRPRGIDTDLRDDVNTGGPEINEPRCEKTRLRGF